MYITVFAFGIIIKYTNLVFPFLIFSTIFNKYRFSVNVQMQKQIFLQYEKMRISEFFFIQGSKS